jgi:hypothetical protein
MNWLALACTAEGELLAWNESLAVLESACGGEFRAICRVYSVDEKVAEEFKKGNLDYVLRFKNARTTEFVAEERTKDIKILSMQLQAKVNLTIELGMRIAHGYKRFNDMVPWQQEAYKIKAEQANRVISNIDGDIGMVVDYANVIQTDILTAAKVIKVKSENQAGLIRKLEYIRLKHQDAIRKAIDKEDMTKIRAAMEEDSFLSMLM